MLSIIFPTRNRSDLLACALGSLKDQSLPPNQFEVLVIDNGSMDQTAAVVKDLTSTLDNLHYYHEPELGLHAGRHRGMMEANGDILVFADDDIEALPTWLAAINEAFSDPEVAMVGGNNLPMFLEPPPAWLKSLWDRPSDGGGRSLGALSILELPHGISEFSPYLVWGCNFAIREAVLRKAGGFHPDGMPQELIRFRGDGETHLSRFVAESGLKCLFHPGASVYHKVTPERMTVAYFRQRGYSQGVSDSYTALRGMTSSVAPRRSIPYRLAHWGWRRLRTMVTSHQMPTESVAALEEMTTGHREGYAFHQHAYRTDPEVRAWVHRERYF